MPATLKRLKYFCRQKLHFFNPFLANVPILYPLRAPENQRFFGVFRGYKMEALARTEIISQPHQKRVGI